MRHIYYTDETGQIHRENASNIYSNNMAAGIRSKRRGIKPVFYVSKDKPIQHEHLIDIEWEQNYVPVVVK